MDMQLHMYPCTLCIRHVLDAVLHEGKGYFGQQASTDQCPSSNVHPIKAKAPSAHIPGREGMKAAEGARACSTSGVILRSKPVQRLHEQTGCGRGGMVPG